MAIYNSRGQQVIQSKNSAASPSVSAVDILNRIDEERHGGEAEAAAVFANPYAFNQISYPSDITTNPERGHYMLFYVNVQDKTKYKHTGVDGVTVGNQIATFHKGGQEKRVHGFAEGTSGTTTVDSYTTWGSAEGKWKYDSVMR